MLIRIQACPVESPVQLLLAQQQEEAEQRRNAAEIDKTLAIFKPGG